MVTWQIFPIAGGHYRWVPVGGSSDHRNKISQILAHQVIPPSELLEGSNRVFRTGGSARRSLDTKGRCVLDNGAGRCSVPMFRTGSGKTVSVTERSIEKARSVLDVEDGVPFFSIDGEAHDNSGSLLNYIEGCNGAGRGSVPMFCTGYGKPVSVTERSMKKARSVLDVEDGVPLFSIKARATPKPLQRHDQVGGSHGSDMPMFCTGSGKPVSVTRTSIEKARSILGGGDDIDFASSKCQEGQDIEGVGGLPMFHTGQERSVSMMTSSIDKARSILYEGNNRDRASPKLQEGHDQEGLGDFPMFHTGLGRSVSVMKSSMDKVWSVLEEGDNINRGGESKDNNLSMFRTGSGKAVSMKQSSLRKARTVLEQDAAQNAPSKLLQGHGQEGVGLLPMFRTRLGRSVSVMKSSSVLEEGDNIDRENVHILEGG